MINVGDKVKAVRMAKDSFYTQVIGTVEEVRNGWATIRATEVKSKWSKTFEQHPTSCMASVKIEDCQIAGA